MSEFFSKIENFLFDVLGLILPGVIFLLILISPVSFLADITKIPETTLSNSFILSALVTFFKILKIYWVTNMTATITILLITAYLIGHAIKVFSIIIYEFLTMIFDRLFNRIVFFLRDKLLNLLKWLCNKTLGLDLIQTVVYKELNTMFSPINNTISKIFTFKSPDYFSDNDSMRTTCIDIVNQRLNTNYPDKWYSLYKLSIVIQEQEGIKSMSGFYLAKYNLYRSLSFIFIFTTIYYYYFFQASEKFMSHELEKIASIILYTSIFLWFTFHYKFKRYWTLCGNETLVSLYYFLNKKKINEA